MSEMNETLRARLSAYLDGELSSADAEAVEILVEKDPEIAAELEALQAADAAIFSAFDDLLKEPVPIHLAQVIQSTPSEPSIPSAANTPSAPRGWGFGTIAASLALLIVGGSIGGYAGYTFAPAEVQVAQRGWLADVADYHRFYAKETRHLAEVPPTEVAHIENWMGDRTGVPFTTPDLTDQGLEFAGGRLLVAAGKPVAQLLYTSDDGTVFALCFLASEQGPSDGFADRSFDDVDMVAWRTENAAYVVAGPEGSPKLRGLAEVAATRI